MVYEQKIKKKFSQFSGENLSRFYINSNLIYHLRLPSPKTNRPKYFGIVQFFPSFLSDDTRFFAVDYYLYSKNVPSAVTTTLPQSALWYLYIHHITASATMCNNGSKTHIEKPNRFITLIIITDRVISDESNFLLGLRKFYLCGLRGGRICPTRAYKCCAVASLYSLYISPKNKNSWDAIDDFATPLNYFG